MKTKCICCKNYKHKVIWNDKIRVGKKNFSLDKKKIFACLNCDLVSLEKKSKKLENSSIARNLYNNNNSIKTFLKFHTPREIKKIKFIENHIKFKKKKILESNCGSGILLNYLKKKSKITAGLDNKFYSSYVKKNGHIFFNSLNEIIKKKEKFDIILSLSELEHKLDPISFLKSLKRILKEKGLIVLRIPNFNNIYMHLIGKDFLRYDYRSSHNYYFSEKNLDMIFFNLKFKIIKKLGFNEYSFNHLLTYFQNKKRVSTNDTIKFLTKKKDIDLVSNIEKKMISTSLIYIIRNDEKKN